MQVGFLRCLVEPTSADLHSTILVLDQPSSGPPRISGITQLFYTSSGPCAIPNDPQKAKVGFYGDSTSLCHEYTLRRIRDLGKSRDNETFIAGYPVHMHCWKLLTRVIGEKLVENNLDILLETVYETAAKGYSHWKLSTCWTIIGYRSLWPTSDQLLAHAARVPRLIAEARKMHIRTDSIKKRWTHPLIALPAELMMMIIEQLASSSVSTRQGIKNTINTMYAFQWILEDSYWQGRCNRAGLIECGDIDVSDQLIDWQFLSLKVQLLLDHLRIAEEFDGRQHLLKWIQGLEKRFLKNLNKATSTHLITGGTPPA